MNKETIQNLISQDKITILDFFAIWCQPCKILSKKLLSLDTEKYNIIKIDIEKNPELADEYGVTALPTLLIYKSSNFLDKLVGVPSQDLNEYLEKISLSLK